MAYTACEMVWLKNLLIELGFRQSGSMSMHCDNQSAIYIVSILYFMKGPNTLRLIVILSEMLGQKRWSRSNSHRLQSSWLISLPKAASLQVLSNLRNKLGMLDLYAPA